MPPLKARALKMARSLKRFLLIDVKERMDLRRLRRSLRNKKHANASRFKPSRIFFNTQYPWSYIGIEYMAARELQKRGHEVNALLCDGVPYCEQETLTAKRPSCGSCFKRSTRYASAFDVPYQTVNEFLTQQDRKDAAAISRALPVSNLRHYTIHGVDIGEIAYRNLAHYFKGIFDISGDVENKYRTIFESAYLVLLATQRYFQQNELDIAVSANGLFVQSGIGIDYAKSQNKSFVTWEVFNQFTGAIFAKNSIALEQRIDDVWDSLKDIPLTEEQRSKIYKNFDAQAKSENTPFKYQESHYLATRDALINQLKLNPALPIITLFSNVEWDSTAMIASGFESMLDWLSVAIDYAALHSDYQVIIRAHPGELKVPYDLKTNSPICERIRGKYPVLPGNVRLIEPMDPVQSYALGELSDVMMVYSSTMGLEFALRGIKPWVAAKTYYYGKGFTVDLASRQDMFARLDRREFKQEINEQEKAYAERLAYIVRYRRLFRFPYFKDGRFEVKAYLKDLNKPHDVIRNVCDVIDSDRHCLDLGESNW